MSQAVRAPGSLFSPRSEKSATRWRTNRESGQLVTDGAGDCDGVGVQERRQLVPDSPRQLEVCFANTLIGRYLPDRERVALAAVDVDLGGRCPPAARKRGAGRASLSNGARGRPAEVEVSRVEWQRPLDPVSRQGAIWMEFTIAVSWALTSAVVPG